MDCGGRLELGGDRKKNRSIPSGFSASANGHYRQRMPKLGEEGATGLDKHSIHGPPASQCVTSSRLPWQNRMEASTAHSVSDGYATRSLLIVSSDKIFPASSASPIPKPFPRENSFGMGVGTGHCLELLRHSRLLSSLVALRLTFCRQSPKL